MAMCMLALCVLVVAATKLILITIFMVIAAQKEKATGEKGPATVLELGTYALTRSFSHASHGNRSRATRATETDREPREPRRPIESHASHGDRSRSFVPIALMYRSQVCRYLATLKTCALRLVCYVMVAGSAAPSTGEKGPATALELGTYALRSLAEFQPREPRRPVLFPLSPVAFSF